MNYKIKNIIGICLLFGTFVIICLFPEDMGNYYNWYTRRNLFVISLTLLILPLIIKLVSKKRIYNIKGKIICFINSLIICMLLTIYKPYINIKNNYSNLNIAYTDINHDYYNKQILIINSIVGINYYFINMCFFVENKPKVQKNKINNKRST